jgi:cell division control protein 11
MTMRECQRFPHVSTSSDLNNRFQEILAYLERQYDDILAEQSRIKRNPRFKDNRVHAVLYFIPPGGHAYVICSHCLRAILIIFLMVFCLTSLRELDIELMKQLSPRVNVIPVIGRSDSLTPAELKGFKKRVRTLYYIQ